MKLSHTLGTTSAVFDDPNLVSSVGLVPALALAESAGLRDLTDQHLSVPTDKGANAGLKVASLVAGMVAGADSIDDMTLLRHGGMGRIFARAYAPSTLGSFLRAFTFGHVRQLDAVATRFLVALAGITRLLGEPTSPAIPDPDALLDVDDTIVEVHGHAKQGAGFGYSGVRGLNALLATLATATSAPVIVAQRLRKGACGSPRGAKRLVGDAVKQARRLMAPKSPVLVRMDSAFYGRGAGHAAVAGGAAVSVTVRMDPAVKKAIAAISEDAWTTIEYTDAVYDQLAERWVSRAEVAEIEFTAFAAQKKTDPGPGPTHRAPDPGLQRRQEGGSRTRRPVRCVALPRLLHHRRPQGARHRRRGQDPPRARDHREGPRRPQRLRARALALWGVRRQRRLAGARGDGLQPDPGRRRDRWPSVHQSDHSHVAPQAHQRPGQDRDLGPPDHPAPAHRLALAELLDSLVRPGQRPSSTPRVLTPPSRESDARHQFVEHPGRRGPALLHALKPPGPRFPAQRRTSQSIGGSRLRARVRPADGTVCLPYFGLIRTPPPEQAIVSGSSKPPSNLELDTGARTTTPLGK